MRRIAWRKVLPIVQTAAYILLVWYGCWYRPTWQHWIRNWISPRPDATGWYPAWIDGIEPFPELFASGLNFPAVGLSALTIMPFEHSLSSGASRELALHILAVIFVPLLWYGVGKRLDRRGRTEATTLSRVGKVFTIAGLTALVFIALLMAAALVMGERYTMAGLSLTWVGCGMLVTWSRLRRWRGTAPSLAR